MQNFFSSRQEGNEKAVGRYLWGSAAVMGSCASKWTRLQRRAETLGSRALCRSPMLPRLH